MILQFLPNTPVYIAWSWQQDFLPGTVRCLCSGVLESGVRFSFRLKESPRLMIRLLVARNCRVTSTSPTVHTYKDRCPNCTLIKKENQIFLIYKEIQNGAVAKSYIRKGFLIYEKMCKYFPIYEEAVSHTWLCNCSISEFPYI